VRFRGKGEILERCEVSGDVRFVAQGNVRFRADIRFKGMRACEV